MFTAQSFDRYQTGESPIHRLDPRVKLLITIAFIVSNVLLPDGAWLPFGLSLGLVDISTILSELNYGFVFKRSLIALPFTLAAVTLIFTMPGNPLLAFEIGPWQFTISNAGLVCFSSIVVRSWLSVQMAILLTATTTFPNITHGLRHLRVPLVLIAILSFMYRYLFVLGEEAVRLIRARDARSAISAIGNPPSLLWRARITGNMVGQLFLRSYERSDRVYNAMVARGFRGDFLTFTPHQINSTDWLTLITTLLLLVGLQLLSSILI